MKRIDWKVFVLLGIIVSVAVGFLYGTGLLGGSTGDPGSREDPLASQSYADATIDQRVRAMDDRIKDLEAKVQSLENELSILTGDPAASGTSDGPDANGGSAPPPSGSTGTGTSSSSGSGTASAANVGKSAAVTAETVNLRESASTSSNIKKRLTPSDTFTITKADKDWYQVQLSDGTVGWVFAAYVKPK